MKRMKRLVVIGAVGVIVMMGAKPAVTFATEPNTGMGYLTEQLGLMQKGSKLIGTVVRDGENHKLGKIEQFVVDLNSGMVYSALVSPSGDSKGKEGLVAVPARSFCLMDQIRAMVDLRNAGMADAPRFPNGCPDQAAMAKSMREAYAHFHQKALWDEKAGLGQVCKSTSLVGMEVRSKAGEKLGRLTDLMIDVGIGRIIYAVISFDGTDASLYAVPPTSMALSSDSKTLVLDADKAKVTEQAKPDAFFWTDMADPNWALATYRAYGKSPDFDRTVNTPPQLAREKSGEQAERAATSENKVAGKSDSEISQIVMTAVVRDDIENAFACKAIRISTVNGHVTLSGKIKNPKLRVKFAEIAAGIVGSGNVSNLLASQ
ncbi:MAG: photosystem reaction center subunit [Pedosphaera sp.]|nr:photosystem reaction center subunit [Pedosphaera sp.]